MKKMTDCSDEPIIHLHEDVWKSKPGIVRSRLLTRLGRTEARIFARKTTSRRINSDAARSFLEEHHLWSSTKAKHSYGLFAADNELVAVATFSKGRTVMRDGIPHKSHELLRFCTRRDETVVGGITKLIKAFVIDQKPDDIITVVDRDWGSASGWHSLGFETVHIMSPLIMVVAAEDGVRRHLVGAGIQHGSSNKNGARLGLLSHILTELSSITNAVQALECLARHSLYPVYDTGVERLMMLLPNSEASRRVGDTKSGLELWEKSVPSYASSYYSSNSGIAALLKSIEEMDSQAHNEKNRPNAEAR